MGHRWLARGAHPAMTKEGNPLLRQGDPLLRRANSLLRRGDPSLKTWPAGWLANWPTAASAGIGSDDKFLLYKCRIPAGLGTSSSGCGLPTLGHLCEALPNIEQVLRPTGVWQQGILELTVFSEGITCRLRPVHLRRVWVSEGLTQADS